MIDAGQELIRQHRWAALGVLLLAALVVPPMLPPYGLTIMILAVIFSILAIGLNILMGYTGLDSLGQAAFYGVAAYSLGLLTSEQEWSWLIAALVGILGGTAVAAIFGLLAVRLRGLYFLLITLALGQVLWGVVLRWGDVTGGQNGMGGVTSPTESLEEPINFYYFALVILIIAAVAVHRLLASPFGLSLQGIREREVRMRTLGHRTWLYKYFAFIIAGLLASLAGTLAATYNGFVSPDDISLETSFDAMLMVILGGSGTFFGPILGAGIVTALQYLLSIYVEDYWLIIVGVIYMMTMTYLPDGIIGWIQERRLERERTRRAIERKKAEPAGTEPGPEDAGRPLPTKVAEQRLERIAVAKDAPPPDTRVDEETLGMSGVKMAYGNAEVLDGVTASIKRGERVGVIGPNGAGKTTLFNIISGLIEPTSGRIAAFGKDISKLSPAATLDSGLSRTFQVTSLFPKLTVIDNLRLALLGSAEFRRYRFVLWRSVKKHPDMTERAMELLEVVGLDDVRDEQVRHLSYGHQRQLELGLALASRPSVLLLDEPTAGLSQADIGRMVRLLKALPEETTLVMVEHNLDVIFDCVERLVVLHDGRVVADGPQSEVRADERIKEIYFGSVAT